MPPPMPQRALTVSAPLVRSDRKERQCRAAARSERGGDVVRRKNGPFHLLGQRFGGCGEVDRRVRLVGRGARRPQAQSHIAK
eukprot:6961836-Prymnesium_polylepis.1